MPFVVLIVGAILLIAAWRNAHGDLGAALAHDVPPFLKWALALTAVAAIGWVPKLQPISRALLGLVLVVLLIRNYQAFFGGFTNLATSGAPAASTVASTPAAALTADATATGTSPSTANVQGTGSSDTASAGSSVASVQSSRLDALLTDPSTYLHAYETALGFGGTA